MAGPQPRERSEKWMYLETDVGWADKTKVLHPWCLFAPPTNYCKDGCVLSCTVLDQTVSCHINFLCNRSASVRVHNYMVASASQFPLAVSQVCVCFPLRGHICFGCRIVSELGCHPRVPPLSLSSPSIGYHLALITLPSPLATGLSPVVSDVENVPGSGFPLWIYSGSPIGNCYKGEGCRMNVACFGGSPLPLRS